MISQNLEKTYLLVGYVTKDLLPDDEFIIGGTVTYASVVAKQLGWQPMIITAADSQFEPPSYLSDVNWCILPSPETTTFRNLYDADGHRRQIIGPIARSIDLDEVSDACRQATIVHLCPLAQELTPASTEAFQASHLVATPQGWMREWDDQGVVTHGDWRGAGEILPKLQLTVVSIEDIDGDWSAAEKWATQTSILIVTHGETGCTIMQQGRRQVVPSRPSQPVDPTGAGDVFAAACAIRFLETGDIWQAARFANVTASMAIERPGSEAAPSRAEVEAYLA